MRHVGLLVSIVSFLLLGTAITGMHQVTRAQELTPVAGIEPEGGSSSHSPLPRG